MCPRSSFIVNKIYIHKVLLTLVKSADREQGKYAKEEKKKERKHSERSCETLDWKLQLFRRRWSCLIWRGVLIWRWRGFPLCNGSTRGRNELEFHNNGSRTQRKPVALCGCECVSWDWRTQRSFVARRTLTNTATARPPVGDRVWCRWLAGDWCQHAGFALPAVPSVRPAAPVRLRGDLPQER